eukprot:6173016-Pleurochrysis_carterae.AAC.1
MWARWPACEQAAHRPCPPRTTSKSLMSTSKPALLCGKAEHWREKVKEDEGGGGVTEPKLSTMRGRVPAMQSESRPK